ncbi:thioredoxin-like protein [Stagonosporopsis vannaccii]|nr:thioredoxin-like protein [Stagonosporopsis vannaccii]
MHPILYAIIGVVVILVIGPDPQAVFADRSPIPETSGKVTKVHAPADLSTLLSTTKYLVVDFYADWCPPCRTIAPIFSQLADQHATAGKLGFAKVNVDHVKDVAVKYGISAMPTFLFFEDGKPVEVKVERKGRKEGVEMVRGADVGLLRAVVLELAGRV